MHALVRRVDLPAADLGAKAPTVDGNVLGQFAAWLNRYVRHIRGLDDAAALGACLSEGVFWNALPQVMYYLLPRR